MVPGSGIFGFPLMLEGLGSVKHHAEPRLPLLLPCALLYLLCCFLSLRLSRLLCLSCSPLIVSSTCARYPAGTYTVCTPLLPVWLGRLYERISTAIGVSCNKPPDTIAMYHRMQQCRLQTPKCLPDGELLSAARTFLLRRHIALAASSINALQPLCLHSQKAAAVQWPLARAAQPSTGLMQYRQLHVH